MTTSRILQSITTLQLPRRHLKKFGGGGAGAKGGGYSGSKAVVGTIFRGDNNNGMASSEQSYLIAVAIGAAVVFVLMLIGVILLHLYRQRIRQRQQQQQQQQQQSVFNPEDGLGRYQDDDDQTIKTDADEAQDDPFYPEEDRLHNTLARRQYQ